jgi:SAM-dependent methyltransferase
MSPPLPADWQLPPGVSRGLWQYLHDPAIAREYDAGLAGSTLFEADRAFVERHCPPPGRLADLGCGTGRLLLHLAPRGYHAIGIDLSPEMLKVARARAAAAGVFLDLVRANLARLEALAAGSFDYAACLFSTLGMVAGADHRQGVLDQAARLLRPGGKLILHVHNRWFNAWDPQGRRWLLRNLFAATLGREGAGDRSMPAHRGGAGLTLHLSTRREVRQMLRRAGLRLLEVMPVGLGPGGILPWPWWQTWLRAYGYLLAAQKPSR